MRTVVGVSFLVLFVALSAVAISGPSTLPPVPVPDENPITAEKAILGKMLFWDEQLSSDNTMACGTCHRSAFGGADPRLGAHPGPDGIFGFSDPDIGVDDLIGSPGVIRTDANGHYIPDTLFGLDVQVTGRASPTAFFGLYAEDIFWDGRARSEFRNPETGAVSIASGGALESQAVGPILSHVEMAGEGRTWSDVADTLTAARPMALAPSLTDDIAAALTVTQSYPALFKAAFGSTAITAERIGFAIATYERTLVPDQTPYDMDTMTPEQQNGLTFLTDHTVCLNCHVPPQFTDNLFYNIGLRPSVEDLGRMLVTNDPADAGRFKTPTLRNAGLKRSLDHVGWIVDLEDSIDYYNAGTQNTGHVQFTDDQDSIPPGGGTYHNINMPEQFQTNVLDFLTNALTDPRVAAATPPFDRPSLHSELAVPNPLVTETGSPGSGGVTPRIIAVTPPNLGNADCRVGIADALGGAEACVAMSQSPPIDGVLDDASCFGPFLLDGTGAGAGYQTFFVPIADDPNLIDDVFYVQWIVTDAGAADGEARTPVARLTVFCHRGCPVACPADVNASGDVDVGDVLAVLAAWGPCAACPEDVNGDGEVGIDELLMILSQWGPCT
jgi:cytochrome c peroxidase